MKLGKDDIVGVGVISKDTKDATLLVMSENGWKENDISEYKTQSVVEVE
ncbi:MAG: hypothetical protein R3B39_02280 [Candidatus Paceibacterota bacterium]